MVRGSAALLLLALAACGVHGPVAPHENVLHQQPTLIRNRTDIDGLAGRYLYVDGILAEAPAPYKGTHAVLNLPTGVVLWLPNMGVKMAGRPWADHYAHPVRVAGILRASTDQIQGYTGPTIEIVDYAVIP